MKPMTRKDYEALIADSSGKRKKRRRSPRLRGGAKNDEDIIDLYQRKSAFIRHYPIISLLGSRSVRRKLRKAVIKALDEKEMKGVTEIVNNFLRDKIPISDEGLRLLRKDRRYLHDFLSGNLPKQKKVLEQKGGLFQALIPLAASALSPIISTITEKLLGR